MIEKELQELVRKLATMNGWLCYHTYDSRRSEPGFPDLVLVRGDRLLFVELKSKRGTVEPEQREWLSALKEAGAETHLWRPSHWNDGTVESVLKRSRP